MVVTIDCRDTINCRVTIVLCNRALVQFYMMSVISSCNRQTFPKFPTLNAFNPKKTGGGGGHDGPLDISRDYSATREALAAILYDNFLSSFPHILTPNLWWPGVWFRSYVTFCTCTSDRKWQINANWVFSLSSYKYAYFYSQWLKLICFGIIVLQKVSATNFAEKQNKTKRLKNKEILKKFIKQ